MSTHTAIPFYAAQKLTQPQVFTTMVKPVGSTCNLGCSYCYYLEKAALYDGHQPCMSPALLETYIRQYIEAVSAPVVTFCWHGGEPLIAGLDFYRRAMELQEKYRGTKTIENTLQTNGMLINEEWCTFFHDYHFLIGLSLDGPQDIHDAFRLDRGGRPTFDRVLRAVHLMASMGVEFNLMCTVNARSAGRGVEVYRFLRALSPFIQFLPVLEYADADGHIVPPGTEGASPTAYSITSAAWGEFICAVWDEWVKSDVGRIFVQLFDVTLSQWCGMKATLCSFSETCGDGLVVEHNGDVYACDHFVYPEYRLGNISETPLADLQRLPAQFRFGAEKFDALPRQCRVCRWLFLCHGECPKHRFATTSKGEPGLSSLCKGYKQFFEHTASDMQTMRRLLEHQQPPALIMREK